MENTNNSTSTMKPIRADEVGMVIASAAIHELISRGYSRADADAIYSAWRAKRERDLQEVAWAKGYNVGRYDPDRGWMDNPYAPEAQR